MNTVMLRTVEIGAGRPKVIVPIVAASQAAILDRAAVLPRGQFDVVEWRIDFYEDCADMEKTLETLRKLRETLGDIPILATFRTRGEGGERDFTKEGYIDLIKTLAQSGQCDAVDVELFTGDEEVCQVVEAAHAAGTAVVGSSHDFDGTPSQEEMVRRLCRQQELGCDILKLAVMPRSRKDVLALLCATEEMYTAYANQPIVTMSMGALGVVSRLCGGVFGSAMTFGAVGQGSAPGQVQAEKLNQVLELL